MPCILFRNPVRVARSLVVALSGLALVSCKDVEQTAAGPSDIGGTMVVSSSAEPATILLPLTALSIERQISDLVYDRLAELGDDLNTVGDRGFKPVLAEKWEWAPD